MICYIPSDDIKKSYALHIAQSEAPRIKADRLVRAWRGSKPVAEKLGANVYRFQDGSILHFYFNGDIVVNNEKYRELP